MTCKDYQELIEKHLDGFLQEAELDALQKHAEQCPACQEALRAVTGVQTVMREAFTPRTASARARDAILSRLAKTPSPARSASRRLAPLFARRRVAMAAGVLIVGIIIGAGAVRLRLGPRMGMEVRAPVPIRLSQLEGTVLVKHRGTETWQEMTLSSPLYLGDLLQSLPNSKVTLKLPDGSTVALAPNSSLSLEVCDGGVELALQWGSIQAGLASPHPPFVVRTPQARVEALGTEFTVTVR